MRSLVLAALAFSALGLATGAAFAVGPENQQTTVPEDLGAIEPAGPIVADSAVQFVRFGRRYARPRRYSYVRPVRPYGYYRAPVYYPRPYVGYRVYSPGFGYPYAYPRSYYYRGPGFGFSFGL